MKTLMLGVICAAGLLLDTGCQSYDTGAAGSTGSATAGCDGSCCKDPFACAKCCGDAAGCAKCCKKP